MTYDLLMPIVGFLAFGYVIFLHLFYNGCLKFRSTIMTLLWACKDLQCN